MKYSTTSTLARLSRWTVFVLLLVFCAGSASAQWERTNGPYGANVLSVYQDGETTYAGTYGNGLFRSEDHGKSWSHINTGSVSRYMYTILVSDGAIYVGTDAGVGISRDNGQTWQTGLTAKLVWRLTVFDTNVIALTTAGIYQTMKAEARWRSVSPQSASFYGICSAVRDSSFYLGTTTGLYKLKLGETHWQMLDDSMENALYLSGDTVFIGTQHGIRYTTDDGATWTTAVSGPMTDTVVVGGLAMIRNIFFAFTSVGTLTSFDRGTTWSKVPGSLGDAYPRQVVQTSDNVIYGDINGLHTSPDLRTWTLSNTGLTGRGSTALGIDGTTVYGATGDSIYSSTDNGRHWESAFSNVEHNFINQILFHNGSIFIADAGYGVQFSSDHGQSWTLRNKGMLSPKIWSIVPYGDWLNIGVYPDGGYRSSNNGESWTRTSGLLGWGASYAVGASGLWAAAISGIYRSADSGGTWSLIPDLPSTYGFSVSCSGNTVYAIPRNSGVYASEDDGATWRSPSESLPSFNDDLVFAYEDLVFATSALGVAVSRDNGATWMDASQGLEFGGDNFSLLVSSGELMLASEYGFFRRPLAQFRSLDVPATWAPTLSLSIGPNPTSSFIELRGSAIENAVITVTDVTGNEVGKLLTGNTPAAFYDLSKLASGQYFVTATTRGASITRSVIRR